MTRLPAEWEPQDGIVLAWPHKNTDWNENLTEAQLCVAKIINNITDHQRVILLTPEEINFNEFSIEVNNRLTQISCNYNDTWTRDYIGITTLVNDELIFNNFNFNAWGNKFEYEKDNNVNLYFSENLNAQRVDHNFVLEGGAIESDGQGTILTTEKCLLNKNRNGQITKSALEIILQKTLGAKRVIWLKHGSIPGDDTDAHIDTLARLAPNKTILYAINNSEELKNMEQELKSGLKDYKLIPVRNPDDYKDASGCYQPATYLNFLITNNKVLVPTYQHPLDQAALESIQSAFPSKNVIGINCKALIIQNGSLHCITMQLPKGILKNG